MRTDLMIKVSAALVAGALSIHAVADTASDNARTNADLAEQLKRESDARAAIARNQIEIANGEATARAALTKAQVEAERARSDYYQSLVPNPANYKVAAPSAPKLNARASEMAFHEAEQAAQQIVATLSRVATVKSDENNKCSESRWILPGTAALPTRSLIALSLSTERMLQQVGDQVSSARQDLASAVGGPSPGAARRSLLPATAVAGGAAVLQGVLSIATILKPQFAFDTSNQSTTSGSVLEAQVFGAMASAPCTTVLDTNALLSLVSLSGASSTAPRVPPEIARLEEVRQQVASARADVRAALDKGVAAKDARGERIVAAAKLLSDVATEVEKSLLALYTVDAQGASPIDGAVRGGMLRELLAAHAASTYFLTLKTIASDVDLAAKDGLFVTASTSLASHTIVSWQMANAQGRVVSAGSLNRRTPTEIRPVWP